MTLTIEEKLKQGIEAAEAGHKTKARSLLTDVVTADEEQLEAWVWLSRLVDSLEDKIVCLENVLTLDPDNQFAQNELAAVKAEQDRFFAPVYPLGEEAPPPNVVTLPETAHQPIIDTYLYHDEFDNIWLCPYCAQLTEPDQRRCPHCRQPLIVKRRTREERSVWLRRGIFLQVSIMMVAVSLSSAVFVVLVRQQGIVNPTRFLPLYLGGELDSQLESSRQIVFDTFPVWAFWGLVGFLAYTIVMIFLLYIRVPYGNVLYFISAAISLVMGLFGMIFFYSSVPALGLSAFAFLLGLVQFIVTLNLWNDFTFKEHRIQLRLDRDAKSQASLFQSGRKYSKAGMWGLAAIHLRRAVAANPRSPTYHLALAMAYLNIKRYDLAGESLQQFERLDPHATDIEPLKKQIRAGQAKKRARITP
ncbi:MAG: hypothetical protein H6631_11805 [Anaerolineaceae bacterium]|nr:hypothetical protein [Anaerolineaceae bacterium]MCB9101388.1 hypothetical protein [Anaerolineales bacterium]